MFVNKYVFNFVRTPSEVAWLLNEMDKTMTTSLQ